MHVSAAGHTRVATDGLRRGRKRMLLRGQGVVHPAALLPFDTAEDDAREVKRCAVSQGPFARRGGHVTSRGEGGAAEGGRVFCSASSRLAVPARLA